MSGPATAPTQGQAPAQAAVTTFALFPGMENTNTHTLLDFKQSANQKLYKEGCAGLDFEYEGKGDQLMILKEHVLNKVTKFNWWHITDIPVTNTAGAPTKDLIMQHGQLSYERLRQWAMAEIVGQQTRAAQDNHMLYSCLTKSISQDVMKRLVPDREKYMINREPIAALYFKLLVSKAEVETRATTTNIRKKLNNLQTYISTIDYDITAFHEHVNQQLTALSAYGQGTNDYDQSLIVQLFEAYDTVPDKEWNDLLGRKKSDYLLSNVDLKPKDLMSYGQNIYDYRKDDISSPWLQKTPDQIQIEALSAQLNNLKVQNNKLSKATKQSNKGKKEIEKLTDAVKKATVTNGSEKKSDSKKKKGEGAWAWKFVKPKDEDIDKPTEFRGKKWYWCKVLEKYCTHHPKDCSVEKANANAKGNKDGGKKYNSSEKSATSYNATAQAALAMLAQASTAESE